MTIRSGLWSVIVALLVLQSSRHAEARELTFADRVAAQEAIERVYYGHQVEASKPFKDAVPRAVIVRKVRDSLRQSLALETHWGTRITGEMLQQELRRMIAGSRMPERLRELFDALGNDPVLIRECLARPVLVGRLIRNFYDGDTGIHAPERHAAEALAEDAVHGRIDPWHERPDRTVTHLVRGGDGSESRVREDGTTVAPPEEFEALRSTLGPTLEAPGPIVEETNRFLVRVPLLITPDELRFATFSIGKRPYEEWWRQIQARFDERTVPVAPVADALPALASPVACTDDTWNNASLDDNPLPRYQHLAVWTGSHMIMWGGQVPGGGKYDPATDTWSPISRVNEPPVNSQYSTAVWTGTRMIVWGGAVAGLTNTGSRYDPIADAWSLTATVGAPTARYLHSAVWTGTRMVVWGGFSTTGNVSSGGSYDPDLDQWTPTSLALAPTARTQHSAIWTGTRMLVWGGFGESGAVQTGGSYDPSNDTWSPITTTNAPVGRALHTAIWTGSRMIVWGGGVSANGTFNTGGQYDPASDAWSSVTIFGAPDGRNSHTAVWTGTEMIVWGGRGLGCCGGLSGRNTGGRYNPVSDSWTPTATTNPPSARDRHTAVWTGDRMIVWGGRDLTTNLSTGGRYDPATNLWTPTAGSVPTARMQHLVVWTGNLMVVWGGGDNSGARYDPTLDTWSPTSTVGAPSSSAGMTAVWTGSVMAVWGGLPSAASRYDPVSDTWSPISTVNAPAARTDHVAAWAGGVMVVFGGHSGPTWVNTGGRYDPDTDSWTPTSLIGTAPVNPGNVAVSTGQEMIVWGGGDPSLPGSGGRYDPVADRWTRTSEIGAPMAREGSTGVWTGREAIFWGGGNGSTGRYDPVRDTWVVTPPDNVAAPPRSGHQAVWTGREMVVFGGIYNNRGGRYDPTSGSWRPLSSVNMPPGFLGMSAVWADSFMIVWGGRGAGGADLYNTGGRYCACKAWYADDDGDGVGDFWNFVYDCSDAQPAGHVYPYGDCNDQNGASWDYPSEVENLTFTSSTSLSWSAPVMLGGVGVSYDLLRSPDIRDLFSNTTCIVSDDTALGAADAGIPPPGSVYFYLPRAQNGCPGAHGSLGAASDGTLRIGRSCP